MMKVAKRDGREVPFDRKRIENAVRAAMKNGSGIVDEDVAVRTAESIEKKVAAGGISPMPISTIEAMVFDELIERGHRLTAKAYEGYRRIHEFQRVKNTVDDAVMGIVRQSDPDKVDENSNKNARVNATQRDLIAGEFSKDYVRRNLIPADIVQAHDEGIIHFHDMDYFIQPMINCCLVNLKDMFEKGTVINGKLIERPKSLQTAATLATQIVQQIASGQYGGQTISIAHLSPFVRVSLERHRREAAEDLKEMNPSAEDIERVAQNRLAREVKAAIQTIQYQINTFNTGNGQSPFLSIFMYLNEEPEYIEETAMLIREMLRQRTEGMKNAKGAYISPAFPKLLYVLDENNVPAGSRYRYLTDEACVCVAKRMMPDFISAKKMKENYQGQVFGPMGCRSFLSPYVNKKGEFQFYGRFNQGVVTLNLVDVALSSDRDIDRFWKVLDQRLDLCYRALMVRHEALLGTVSDVSPIHWQHGGLARLKPGEKIDEMLNSRYSTLSLGYIGLSEAVTALTGKPHTEADTREVGLSIMRRLRRACDEWKERTGLGFALYGTPAESTTYKFAKALQKRFGIVPGITDHLYITNSYHVNVRQPIGPFEKLAFESQFQDISSGGAISYIEVANITSNIDAIRTLVDFMYDTIQYAEINTKSDYCQKCGFDGEIILDENLDWKCPNCGNRDRQFLNVTRRTCGYLGDNFWNRGRTQEIAERFVHLDNRLYQ